MNQIKIFEDNQFGRLRAFQFDGKAVVCLSDVCGALDLKNPSQVKTRLDKRGVISMDTPTENQHGALVIQKMTYIDEPNIYRCIFQSRKKEALEFQDWVFSEVLPQIRKTGGFIPVKKEDDDASLMAKALMVAQRTLEQKDKLLEAQRPKVKFADAVAGCEDSILVRDMAKLLCQNGIDIGEKRLYRWFREHGYVFLHENRPMQKYVEQGLFELRVSVIETHHGQREVVTMLVTGKGQQYFINKFTN